MSFSFPRAPGSRTVLGIGFGLCIMLGPALTLAYGVIGITGNPLATAACSAGVLVAVFSVSARATTTPEVPDVFYFMFISSIIISSLLNPSVTSSKEATLLVFSLFAYIATRSIRFEALDALRVGCLWVSGVIALLGTIATVPTLVAEWAAPHGRPLVFGFAHAATIFAQTLAIFIIALVSLRLTVQRAVLICMVIAGPIVVFSASMVRLSFGALLAAVALSCFLVQGRNQKLLVGMVGVVIAMAIATGLAMRPEKARVFVSYIAEPNVSGPADAHNTNVPPTAMSKEGRWGHASQPIAQPPSCHLIVNRDNSVAIRKALAQDALFLIPKAGLFGWGLDAFVAISCMGMQVHNAVLQALIEFGWVGGISFALLIASVLVSAVRSRPMMDQMRFIICCFVFVVAINLFHGRISRDIEMFALAGALAGIISTWRSDSDLVVAEPAGHDEPEKK